MTPLQLIYATKILIIEQINMQSKLDTLILSVYLFGVVLAIVLFVQFKLNKELKQFREVRSSRQAHNLKITGSNPVTATIIK